jgi:hypothetical protein
MMLDIASDQLNEISLEDVEIQQAYQHHIYKTLYDMVALDDLYNKVPDGQDESPRVPAPDSGWRAPRNSSFSLGVSTGPKPL